MKYTIVEGKRMNKKDLKAVLLASALGSAAFVAPVMAEENSQDPVDVNDQTTQTVTADDQTTNTELADENTVTDGWSDDGNYYYENGQKVVSQFKTIDGKTYYFLDDGWLWRDGILYLDGDQFGDQYYFDANGVMQTNFEYNHQYFGADGKAAQNTWVEFDGKWRYYNDLGDYLDGYFWDIDDGEYSFDDDGYALTGWQKIYDTWHYLSEKGMLLKNQWVDGDQYYVDEYGRVVTNSWIDNSIYVGSNGKKTVNQWVQVDGKWRYKLGDGNLYAIDVIVSIDGKLYYFDSYGYLVVSDHFICEDVAYVADENGFITRVFGPDESKWVQNGNNWYYVKNGKVLRNTIENIDGKYYAFDDDRRNVRSGTFLYFDVSLQKDTMYYCHSDGVVEMDKKNTWFKTEDCRYVYFGEDGLEHGGFTQIDNKTYYLNSDGYLEIGVFDGSDTYPRKYYVSDESGAVDLTPGWKTYLFEKYYAKEDGSLYMDTWIEVDGKKYYITSDGTPIFNETRYMDGVLCYFDTNGVLQDSVEKFEGALDFHGTTFLNKDGDKYYTGEYEGYFYEYGVRVSGEVKNGDDSYYVDINGNIKKGWIKEYYGYLYADPKTGVLVNGWQKIDGKWYYFSGNIMRTGYARTTDGLYLFDESGAMVKKIEKGTWYQDSYSKMWKYEGAEVEDDKFILNGTTYYVTRFGKKDDKAYYWDDYSYYGVAKNCVWYDEINEISYWGNAEGTGFDTVTGWKKSNLGDYGYVENGHLVTGYKRIDGVAYYFDEYGYLMDGIVNYLGKAIVIDVNGKIVNYKEGWNQYGDEFFYIKDGMAMMNTIVDDCYLNSEGLTISGRTNLDKEDKAYEWVMIHGKLAKNQWYDDEGSMIYCDENGHVAHDRWIGDRYVDANGVWKPNGSTSQETKAGWKQTNGKWLYQHKDGTYTKNDFETIEGHTYYFDENGYMVTGWKKINNKDYFFNDSGVMVKDTWQGAYYLGSDGVMLTNTFTKDGYYVGSDGAYYTNRWVKDQGKEYYVNGSGKLVKNAWQGAYYLGKDGAILTNAFTPDGYYVGSDGVYVRNQKVTVDGKDYYLNADGKVAKNQWAGDYYLDENGNPYINRWAGSYWCGEDGKYVRSAWVDNNRSYVNESGVYVTNQWIGDYYVNAAGVKVTNAWVGSYWCGEDGKYVKSSWIDNNKSYVNENGVYVTNKWSGDYYVNASGVKVTNEWVGSYWCGSDGKYVKSSWVDNNRYYVNENGLYVAGAWQQDSKGWKYHAGNVYAKDITLNINGTAYTFDSNGYMK